MIFHPDVLAAHAQFGGDLESMQKLYEYPDLVKRIEQLERELASARSEARKAALDDLLADVEALDGARHLMQWMDMSRPTEQSLLNHCARLHRDPPAECRDVDHVPPKALRTLWILREVVAAHRARRLAEQEGT